MAYYSEKVKKIGEDLHRLSEYLHRSPTNNLCAVFDVGTKGVRVIIGPKMTYDEFYRWDPDAYDIFYTASMDTNLGLGFQNNYGKIDIDENESLKDTILFINSIKQELPLNKTDIALVGTAIFRWLDNQEQVLNQVSKKTGLGIEVISGEQEAFYSLLAIHHTYNKITNKRFTKKPLSENDVILLFDQGGGSTEVSYIFPTNPAKIEPHSMFHIGTVALETTFIKKLNSYKGHVTDLGEKVTIEESIHAVKAYISGHLDALKGFKEILPSRPGTYSPYNIRAFGMGTAIKICFEEHFKQLLGRPISGKKFKGWVLTIKEIKAVYNRVKADLINEFSTVKAVYAEIKNNPKRSRDLKPKLQLIYALPTYEMLLEKFGVQSISYAYYNLRYGVYLYKFVTGVAAASPIPVIKHKAISVNGILTAKERVNILSEIKPGKDDAAIYHKFSFDSLIYIFGNRLSNPKLEEVINGGHKRVDIIFDNYDKNSFFNKLYNLYNFKCPKVFIECKNYNTEIGNPELDQLHGRLNPRRGEFGILLCRKLKDAVSVLSKCREYLNDNKAIIVLDDTDIKSLLTMKEFEKEDGIDKYMLDKISQLIL